MLEFTEGEGKFRVRLRALGTESNGLVVFLTGGERPHLGGVALAAPPPEGAGALSRCDSWELTLPGHRDKELAANIARKICIAIKEPVSVSVGIHVDNAAQEEIALLCRNSERAAERFIQEYLQNKGLKV